jgi:hypothetical protein
MWGLPNWTRGRQGWRVVEIGSGIAIELAAEIVAS